MTGRFAVAQMEGKEGPQENREDAEQMMKQAKEMGADLILFPETFMSYVTSDADQEKRIAASQTLTGSFVKEMSCLAKRYALWTVFGMRESAGEKNYNTTVVLNAEGEILRSYHKTHLYDAFGSKESDEFLSGDSLFDPLETPFGKIGLFVCYEARFPEVARYQALHGAEILLMPTAWVRGKRKLQQLEILASSRALENTCYLLAANLCKGQCVGGSMVINPLGEILSQAGEEAELLLCEIDTEKITEIRNTVPSLKNRRPEIY